MTEPVNQFHKTLRVLTDEDPSLQRAITWVHQMIGLKGYDSVRNDPGMFAWVIENEVLLKHISDARRAAYAAT